MTVLPSRTGADGLTMPWVEEFGGFFDVCPDRRRDELSGPCREPQSVARRCTPRRRAAARAWFTSFGTCRIDEPLADLSALRLVGRD
ncbi:hypothetical protein ACFV29_16840 [Streptomyces sp. NPDC059690]|uniref:hypothetical protein n=1 Tax=Streptomyces sp. NPDC059690 TaxID=3346907 RepID=UPI0036C0DFF7